MTDFAHISDIHLGYKSGKRIVDGVNLRELDGYEAYHEAIEEIIKEGVDFVLCTGDLFHEPNPSIRSIREALDGIERLYNNGIPFYCLTGNHDITDHVGAISASTVVNLPSLNSFSYQEPYVVKEVADKVFIHFVSHHAFSLHSDIMNMIELKDGFNILATHGSCYDETVEEVLKTKYSPREVIISEDVLNMNWDYILMGHIHERGWVGSWDTSVDTAGKKRFYGGSLIRRGFSDKECRLGRGWTKWTIENKEMTPKFFLVKQRPQYDIIVNAGEKSSSDILNEIKGRIERIDLNSTPIVRIVIHNISSRQRVTLDLSEVKEISKFCLSFTIKFNNREETGVELSKSSFSFDLVDSFHGYWDQIEEEVEEEYREETKEKSLTYLKEGRDSILEKEK